MNGFVLDPDAESCRVPSVYLLIIYIPNGIRISIGALGEFDLAAGTYIYPGSAKSGLSTRARRHLGSPIKLRWHIDYVTPHSSDRVVYRKDYTKTGECEASREMNRLFEGVPGVGASDCGCSTHLYYAGPERRWL